MIHPDGAPVYGSLIAAGELVGRACHRLPYAESVCRRPHEGRLASTNLAFKHDDVSGYEEGRRLHGERFEGVLVQIVPLERDTSHEISTKDPVAGARARQPGCERR